jgi:hypothetical protein
MWAFYDILRYSFSSVIWGILIAVACMALFIFLIKGWYRDATFTLTSYLVGVILSFLLAIQCVLIVGSIKIIGSTDYYESEITRIVENVYDATDEVSQGHAEDIIQVIIDRYPLLHYYIGGGEFSGFTAKELPHAIADELRSFMRWYIFRRILWCLGFVLVGAFFVIKTLSKNYRSIRQTERKNNRVIVQAERRRINRRPRR